MSLPVSGFVEPESPLPIALVGNDRLRSAVAEKGADRIAVISSIGEHFLCGSASPDEPLRDRAVICLPTSQEEGKKTALSICDCMDFCASPAARASNRLRLLPPFPPEAERWALMWVESIMCVSVA
jgi:hypothetical protein